MDAAGRTIRAATPSELTKKQARPVECDERCALSGNLFLILPFQRRDQPLHICQ
jgi:hypothetical protein